MQLALLAFWSKRRSPGLPQFGAEWQPAAGDSLITSVIGEVCAAAPEALS